MYNKTIIVFTRKWTAYCIISCRSQKLTLWYFKKYIVLLSSLLHLQFNVNILYFSAKKDPNTYIFSPLCPHLKIKNLETYQQPQQWRFASELCQWTAAWTSTWTSQGGSTNKS